MYYFRITLRFIFGIVTSLYIITILSQILKNGIEYSSGYIFAYTFLFMQIPASLVLIVVSIYSYLTKRVFWSLFRIEYFFFIASVSPFFISWFLHVIWPSLQ